MFLIQRREKLGGLKAYRVQKEEFYTCFWIIRIKSEIDEGNKSDNSGSSSRSESDGNGSESDGNGNGSESDGIVTLKLDPNSNDVESEVDEERNDNVVPNYKRLRQRKRQKLTRAPKAMRRQRY